MKRLLLILIACLSMVFTAEAQFRVSGTVIDSKDGLSLPGATATLVSASTGKLVGNSTDLDGKFSVRVGAGKYTFKVVYLGYSNYEKTIEVKGDMSMGTIKLKPESKELKEVKVAGTMVRQEQRGDTTVFNADAFKVNPDATTEDLVKKLPGMQVSGNSVTSGGESVKKVLVDGKEYFGSDPMAALRNISADMVSSIEVFDKQSDQSQFTGFSDGNEERTINITTKMGLSKGSFGRVYAGYGTDERYEMGGNFNVFNGDHRVSLIGMLNNINQQNFSFDDVTGAMSMGGGRGMRGMFRAGQGGKNRTGSIGVNYTYDKEDKLKIEFSYFYNNNKNVSTSTSVQEYFKEMEEDSLRIYDNESESEGLNNNHRASLRLTWDINENNSIIFTPNVSWQGYTNESWDRGLDSYDGKRYSLTKQDDVSETKGLSGGGNLLWRHKFNKERRTLSLSVGSNVSTNNSEQTSNSTNLFDTNARRNLLTAQETDNENNNVSYNGRIMYTEPIGQYMALQVNYSPSVQISEGDKQVMADTVKVEGDPFDSFAFSPNLSNVKESKYLRQRAGVGLNIFSGKVFNATIGVDWQHATLKGDQEFPYEFETDKSFSSVMPSVMIRLRKDRSINMRLRYRTNTSAPSISQLQKVVDVSNIRVYSTGNENLEQSYSHDFHLFFAKNNIETSRAIFFMGGFTATNNYIATSSVIASKDSIIDQGILLPAGTQFNKPVNMDGYFSLRAHVTLSTPVSWLGSNLNFNVGTNINSRPSLYNGRKVSSDTYNLTSGLTLGSSFSENIDFTLSYNGGYNIVKSTAAASSDYNYYNHTASANVNTLFWRRLVLTTSVSHTMTSGMGEDYDQNYVMWNAAVGYKVFKDRRGEFRLRVNDILDNNQSVNRSIQDAYVQTSTTDVLRQYAMLTFTYKFKPKGNAPKAEFRGPMGPPPGRR